MTSRLRVAGFVLVTALVAFVGGEVSAEDMILTPADVLRYCQAVKGPSARPEYSLALKRPVCSGPGAEGMPEHFTINYAVVCWKAHRTWDFQFLDRGGRRYVQCMK